MITARIKYVGGKLIKKLKPTRLDHSYTFCWSFLCDIAAVWTKSDF